jgi:hypothetical protein
MMKVECPMVACKHNIMKECNKESISLKWRLAADTGSGNIVFMECLQMELQDGKG